MTVVKTVARRPVPARMVHWDCSQEAHAALRSTMMEYDIVADDWRTDGKLVCHHRVTQELALVVEPDHYVVFGEGVNSWEPSAFHAYFVEVEKEPV